jgi:hypothetical protein
MRLRIGNRAGKVILVLMTSSLLFLHALGLYQSINGNRPCMISLFLTFLDLEGMKDKEEGKKTLEEFLHGSRPQTFEELKKELLKKREL